MVDDVMVGWGAYWGHLVGWGRGVPSMKWRVTKLVLQGRTTGEPTQGSSNGLGNVLLGNLGSWSSYGCYCDTYHLLKHCCRPRPPFHSNSFLTTVTSFKNNNAPPDTLQKLLRNGLKNLTKNSACWINHQILQISI